MASKRAKQMVTDARADAPPRRYNTRARSATDRRVVEVHAKVNSAVEKSLAWCHEATEAMPAEEALRNVHDVLRNHYCGLARCRRPKETALVGASLGEIRMLAEKRPAETVDMAARLLVATRTQCDAAATRADMKAQLDAAARTIERLRSVYLNAVDAATDAHKEAVITYEAAQDAARPKTECLFDRLPTEILAHIFYWAGPIVWDGDKLVVPAVCRRWRAVWDDIIARPKPFWSPWDLPYTLCRVSNAVEATTRSPAYLERYVYRAFTMGIHRDLDVRYIFGKAASLKQMWVGAALCINDASIVLQLDPGMRATYGSIAGCDATKCIHVALSTEEWSTVVVWTIDPASNKSSQTIAIGDGEFCTGVLMRPDNHVVVTTSSTIMMYKPNREQMWSVDADYAANLAIVHNHLLYYTDAAGLEMRNLATGVLRHANPACTLGDGACMGVHRVSKTRYVVRGAVIDPDTNTIHVRDCYLAFGPAGTLHERNVLRTIDSTAGTSVSTYTRNTNGFETLIVAIKWPLLRTAYHALKFNMDY